MHTFRTDIAVLVDFQEHIIGHARIEISEMYQKHPENCRWNCVSKQEGVTAFLRSASRHCWEPPRYHGGEGQHCPRRKCKVLAAFLREMRSITLQEIIKRRPHRIAAQGRNCIASSNKVAFIKHGNGYHVFNKEMECIMWANMSSKNIIISKTYNSNSN